MCFYYFFKVTFPPPKNAATTAPAPSSLASSVPPPLEPTPSNITNNFVANFPPMSSQLVVAMPPPASHNSSMSNNNTATVAKSHPPAVFPPPPTLLNPVPAKPSSAGAQQPAGWSSTTTSSSSGFGSNFSSSFSNVSFASSAPQVPKLPTASSTSNLGGDRYAVFSEIHAMTTSIFDSADNSVSSFDSPTLSPQKVADLSISDNTVTEMDEDPFGEHNLDWPESEPNLFPPPRRDSFPRPTSATSTHSARNVATTAAHIQQPTLFSSLQQTQQQSSNSFRDNFGKSSQFDVAGQTSSSTSNLHQQHHHQQSRPLSAAKQVSVTTSDLISGFGDDPFKDTDNLSSGLFKELDPLGKRPSRQNSIQVTTNFLCCLLIRVLSIGH